MPKISLIVAKSINHGIGKNNQLLWHLPNDLKFFKQITSGHTVIMGRKTYESIGRPLPNRRNIVISRNLQLDPTKVETVNSIEKALQICANETEVFIIGGAEIYKQTLPLADRIYLTNVNVQLDADAFFPELASDEWSILQEEHHQADDRHAYDYHFQVLEKIKST